VARFLLLRFTESQVEILEALLEGWVEELEATEEKVKTDRIYDTVEELLEAVDNMRNMSSDSKEALQELRKVRRNVSPSGEL
jgi:hypothetical protein